MFQPTRIIFSVVCAFLLCFRAVSAEAAQTVKIGLLFDGPYWSNQKLIDNIHSELTKLLGNGAKITYPSNAVFNGKFDAERVRKSARALAKNKDLDVVLAIGPESALVFGQMNPLPIPVVALSVLLPVEMGLLDPKTLKPTNPNWTTSYDPSVGNKFYRLMPDLLKSSKTTLICPNWTCEQNAGARKAIIKSISRLKNKVKLLVVTPDNFAEKISTLKEESFVVVDELHGFNETQMKALYKALADKKIRSYTVDGLYGIERGALVTIHELNFVKMGRNYALKIFDILKGRTPGKLIVKDVQNTKLQFNIKTAEKIGYSVPTKYIDMAVLYGRQKKKDPLRFREAMEIALKQNYDIKIQGLIENQSLIQAEEVERGYYPQISSRLDYARKDETRADVFPEPRGQSKFAIKLSQKIYDRELIKTIKSAEYANEIDKRNLEVVNQNIIEQVASAYIDNLLATEGVQIQKDFLEIIRKNREIAQLKFELRETGKGDVLRLEIDLENARIDLVDAQEALFRFQVRLNVLLNLPREQEHQLELAPFSEKTYKSKEEQFGRFFYTPKISRITRDFFTQQALSASPDLKSIDASIRKAEADKEVVQSRFVPTAELSADWFTQLHDEKRALSPTEEGFYNDRFNDGWSAQFKLDIPIFEGGTRFKQLSQANLRISEFMTRRRNLENDLSEQARTDFFNLQRRRRNADFAMRNIQSSSENLKLAELAYREGDLPIIDLLDSQRQLILSQREAVVARFEFYKTLFSLLRTIGKSDLILNFLNEEQILNFRNEMSQYMDQKMREERLSGPPALR